MSVLGEVFDGLEAMSLLQLLLAFVACIGYVAGQGGLFGSRGRGFAWAIATLGAVGFALESTDWTHAAMLLGFAVAGVGLFVASVWVASWTLGFARTRVPSPADELATEPVPAPQPAGARPRAAHASEPAHSI